MYTSKETVKVLLYDLKGHPKNPKKHNDALIQKSITELGYAENIVIDENNVILAGHGRVDALKKTSGAEGGGMEIEAVRITGWTEEEKEKYLLLANQSAIISGFDSLELESFAPEVLEYSGFHHIDTGESGVNFSDRNNEIEVADLGEFDCKCPKCGFIFKKDV